jgi:quercetin dioxygenase-like cupin family protein
MTSAFDAERGGARDVTTWSNGPGDRYDAHHHAYRKTLRCVEGSIVFHLAAGDVELVAGDELVIDAGTEHSATVGPDGVRCAEVHG